MKKQTQFPKACLISALPRSSKDRLHLLLWEPAELSEALWRTSLPWLGCYQSQRKRFKCYSQVGLQQQGKMSHYQVSQLKQGSLEGSNQSPVAQDITIERGEIRCSWTANAEETLQNLWGPGIWCSFSLWISQPTPRVCSHIINTGHVKTLCVC